jgi:hypothetical protein
MNIRERYIERGFELEGSFDYVASGLPKAGEPANGTRFLDDASPWSFSIVVVIPVAPFGSAVRRLSRRAKLSGGPAAVRFFCTPRAGISTGWPKGSVKSASRRRRRFNDAGYPAAQFTSRCGDRLCRNRSAKPLVQNWNDDHV